MDSEIKILYNNTDLFSGVSEPPLISLSNQRFGGNRYLGSTTEFQLKGSIESDSCEEDCDYTIPDNYIGSNCGSCSMQELNYKKYLLLERLKDNIGSFQILSDSDSVHSGSYAKLTDISFEDSNYGSLLPYSISFQSYNEECWVEDFGLEDVSDKVSYKDLGCDVEVRRSVSAKGFKTSSAYDNSFENACGWVNNRTGEEPCPPILLDGYSNLILTSYSQNVDRFGGAYSIDLDYVYSKDDPNSGSILSTTFEYSSGLDFSTVSLRGSVQGGLDNDFSLITSRVSDLDFYGLCSGYFSDYESGILNSGALNLNIDENKESNIVNFSADFNNRSEEDPYIIDSFNFTENLNDGKRCVSFNAEIKSDIGCKGDRNEKILQYYSGFNVDTYVKDKWQEYGLPGVLSPDSESDNFSIDEFNSTISLSSTYCETTKDYPTCLKNLDYTIKFNPPLTQRTITPSCTSGNYYIMQDLGFKSKGTFGIDGSAYVDDCCETLDAVNNLIQFINQEQSLYIKGTNKLITEQSVDWTESGKEISFSYAWSYDGEDQFSETFIQGFEDQVSEALVDIESGILLTSINSVDLIQIVSL